LTYDYQNRRVRKIVETYDGSSWSETLDRKFVWYNWLLLVELDGEDDSVVKKYTWGADLSGQNGNVAASPRGGRLEGAGGIGGLLATRDEAASVSYVHFYDGNGNVTQMIDRSDDSTAAHYEYDAYGNVTYSDGAYKDTNRFQFSTKWWDDETGFGYWGYRYYLATLQHPSHAGHSGCECECVNKKKLPRMHYTFHRVFRRVFLEYQLIPPYYKPKGCTGDFRLTATLKLDGWYGECRAKCKVQE
jgi:hypothetical protein